MDDAQFYLLDSQFQYAKKSTFNLIPERMEQAKKYYNTFIKRHPQSEYRKRADELLDEINSYESI
jgi:outer membrane protein assembly factor BamD